MTLTKQFFFTRSFSAFLLISATALSAQAMTCSDLTSTDGSFVPGISRPEVTISGNTADVTVYLEAGTSNSRSEYTLYKTRAGEYVSQDGVARLRIKRSSASLRVGPYIARCTL